MNSRFLILLFVVTLLGFTSCKNNDNVFKTVLYSAVNVINASTDTLNFFLNGTRQNNASSLTPGSSSGYLTVPSGSENFQFKKAGTSTVLFNVPLTLIDSTNSSVYLTGESTDKAFYTTDNLLLDTNKFTSTVRFVNAAPDAGNLTAFVGDTLSFANRAFKSSSAFAGVGSGQKEIKIYQTGSSVPKIDTVITMQTATIYTLYAKGLVNGTGNSKFSFGIIINY